MSLEPLLAKSVRDSKTPRFEETLEGHTMKVVESFQTMFGSCSEHPTRLSRQWLRFFKLHESDYSLFLVHGLLACVLHDLGKGNNGFQDMVAGRKGFQAIWHDHLSGLFLWLPPVEKWLSSIPAVDKRIVFGAVVGHHLRASLRDFAQPLTPIGHFQIYPDAILEILSNLAKRIGFPLTSSGLPEAVWTFDEGTGLHIGEVREKIKKDMRRFRREAKPQSHVNCFLMAVRAALIQADSCGSGVVRENKDLGEWLQLAFEMSLDAGYIEDSVITPRIRQIETSGRTFAWSDFQHAAESLSSRALLLAPCGSGKTLAAWRWIKSRLTDTPTARVIFLYPTRATAAEGFRDYVSWAPEADASLVSGTAAFELEGMFDNLEDERHGKDFNTEDRLYSLGFWQRRVFSATVDQFLGFMQQVYRSVCLLPLLADSVVVIDEVHSFDRSLFSALKLFLKNFDVPVLCMTASLPSTRKNDLVEECGLQVFPGMTEPFPELEAGASMLRYLIHRLEGEDGADQIAVRALEQRKRVLWVVNTVSRCQKWARRLNALCYHSRFRLEDRRERHVAVVKAFQGNGDPVLAVTTQVCEMSLDLDADVLISEIAPITSMIQRLGRCNRKTRPEGDRIGEAWFYPAEDEMPYTLADLEGSARFLSELEDKAASQVLLERLLEELGPLDVEPERYSAFLENGPWALAREQSLRDDNHASVSAILSTDVARYFALRKERASTDGLLIPVPRRFASTHPRMGRFPLVAESSHYDPLFGFLDHPLEKII